MWRGGIFQFLAFTENCTLSLMFDRIAQEPLNFETYMVSSFWKIMCLRVNLSFNIIKIRIKIILINTCNKIYLFIFIKISYCYFLFSFSFLFISKIIVSLFYLYQKLYLNRKKLLIWIKELHPEDLLNASRHCVWSLRGGYTYDDNWRETIIKNR